MYYYYTRYTAVKIPLQHICMPKKELFDFVYRFEMLPWRPRIHPVSSMSLTCSYDRRMRYCDSGDHRWQRRRGGAVPAQSRGLVCQRCQTDCHPGSSCQPVTNHTGCLQYNNVFCNVSTNSCIICLLFQRSYLFYDLQNVLFYFMCSSRVSLKMSACLPWSDQGTLWRFLRCRPACHLGWSQVWILLVPESRKRDGPSLGLKPVDVKGK